MINDIDFLGGIKTDTSSMWIKNNKTLSRNFRQGNRVYSLLGICPSLTAQPIGSLGGYSSLFLTIKRIEGEYDAKG